MSKCQRTAVVMGVSLMALTGTALASPWGRLAQDYLAISRIDHYRSTDSGRDFQQQSAQTYVEYGLTDHWTIGGQAAQGWQRKKDAFGDDHRAGLIDAELFVQRRFLETGGHVLSVQGLVAPQTPLDEMVAIDTGDQREAAGQIAVLYGFSRERHFIAASTGWRKSFGDDADQWRTDVTIGRHGPDGGMTLLDIYSTVSIGASLAVYGIDYDLVTLAPSRVFKVGRRSHLQIGARFDVAGENIDRGHGAFIALWVGR
ncbi:hypothetical protein [Parvularcula sp. LCG005]|uniref:hypothetical protein n=1 Tax=Parvularcula sp. LCG005 TaxID=3078805 RepID=UPI002942E6CC|nr:hypothetical protein [Parvularcula sp. LCG005]WOI53404.1 hypothetical protein RUI03_00070 [Parvularcula sp. LCG005]